MVIKMKKQNNVVVVALNKILNDGFCQYTHHRTYQTLRNIKEFITDDEYQEIHERLIWTDPDNPDIWTGTKGINGYTEYQYELFSECVKSLIGKYQ